MRAHTQPPHTHSRHAQTHTRSYAHKHTHSRHTHTHPHTAATHTQPPRTNAHTLIRTHAHTQPTHTTHTHRTHTHIRTHCKERRKKRKKPNGPWRIIILIPSALCFSTPQRCHTHPNPNCTARPKCPLSPSWPESARRGCVPPACAALFLPLLHAHVCGHDVRLCQLGSVGALDPWGAVPVSLCFVAWHFFCLSPVPHCQPWPPPIALVPTPSHIHLAAHYNA
jgi:hypothetical protein